jgi:hypothetical protein
MPYWESLNLLLADNDSHLTTPEPLSEVRGSGEVIQPVRRPILNPRTSAALRSPAWIYPPVENVDVVTVSSLVRCVVRTPPRRNWRIWRSFSRWRSSCARRLSAHFSVTFFRRIGGIGGTSRRKRCQSWQALSAPGRWLEKLPSFNPRGGN